VDAQPGFGGVGDGAILGLGGDELPAPSIGWIPGVTTARDHPPEEAAEDTSLARGLRLLLTVADRGEVRADELGSALNMPLSTVYRYLRTLGDFGFVDRHGSLFRAHVEAMVAPGFVHYFKGPTNAAGECMSFCLWNSRAEARAAAARPAHLEAVGLTFESYARYALEFHRVRRIAGGFTFEPYNEVART
jgi:hypothetical protein